MSKLSVVVSAPCDTYSGYGARARDIVKGLLRNERLDVKILNQRWGNTRTGFLKDHNETELASKVVFNLDKQPDIWIQITVPNEFQPIGKYNIGITAGIETTVCDPSWIQGVNRMNLNLVSSNHSKKVFEESKFTATDERTRQQTVVQLESKVEVLFEGVDVSKYFAESSNAFDLSSIEESFCFLFVGHWLQGNIGHDRKNVGYMIKSFLETFKNKAKAPALIMKVSHGPASILDYDRMSQKIDSIRKTVKGKLPNIYIIHGDLSDEEMNQLYNNPKVKSMISFTKGEGFGRPLLEFSMVKKPIIASAWSGQTDFLSPDFAKLLPGTLHNVDNSAAVKNVILPESQWFQPDDAIVGKTLKDMFKNQKKYLGEAKQLAFRNKNEFSLEAMVEKLNFIVDENTSHLAVQQEVVLPKLDLPTLNKV